jgi:hypothetical protein
MASDHRLRRGAAQIACRVSPVIARYTSSLMDF